MKKIMMAFIIVSSIHQVKVISDTVSLILMKISS